MDRPTSQIALIALCICVGLAAAGLATWQLATEAAADLPRGDEAISLAAARDIAEEGVPRLPSGAFYDRDLAFHYLLGAAIAVGGDGPLDSRLPSLIAWVLTALLAGAFVARRITSPVWGLLALVLLLGAPLSQQYAITARTYTLLGLLYLTSAALAIRFLTLRDRLSLVGLLMVVPLLLFSHRLAFAFPILLLAAALVLFRTEWDRRLTLGVGLVGAETVLAALRIFVLRPEDRFVSVADWVWEGADYSLSALGPLSEIGWYWAEVTWAYLPGALVVLMLGLVASGRCSVGAEGAKDWRTLLAWILFAVAPMVGLGLFAHKEPRYLLLCYPTLIVAVTLGLAEVCRRLIPTGLRPVAALVALVVVPTALHLAPAETARLRVPGVSAEPLRLANPPGFYERFERRLRPGDMVLSEAPHAVFYALGQLDGILVARRLPDGSYEPLEAKRDHVYDLPLIGSPEQLAQRIADSQGDVWIFTSRSARLRLGPELSAFIRRRFELVERGPALSLWRASR